MIRRLPIKTNPSRPFGREGFVFAGCRASFRRGVDEFEFGELRVFLVGDLDAVTQVLPGVDQCVGPCAVVAVIERILRFRIVGAEQVEADVVLLASVDDVFNAVLVKGDMLGDVVFYGKGAGKLPTASAVVADVVDALKNGAQVHDSLFWQPADPVDGMLTDPAPAAYYVRVAGIAPAVVEAIYGYGKVVDERYEGCAYFVERADERALAEAARKVEAVGGSVKLVLKRLPEEV